jgi:uncharacterized membrane protein
LCDESQGSRLRQRIEGSALAFLIRWLHVSAVAFVFGGALLIFILLNLTNGSRDVAARRVVFDLMRAFEWAFWASLGLVVATGVGNLGHFGSSLPEPRSEWGRELTVKLALVLAFLIFSAVRTLAVVSAAARLEEGERRTSRRVMKQVGDLYGATAVFVVGIIGLAIALAHA